MEEIWVPIKGREEYYEVSNLGRVRTLFGRVNKLNEPKIMIGRAYTASQTKYNQVKLSNGGKPEYSLVHRLVAEAFIPNPENKPFVNHIDNNGLNNNHTNLEWCTQSENLKHAQKQGRLFEAQSKGGKAQRDLVRTNAKEIASNLVGTQYYKWTVTNYLGIKHHNREYIECTCECGAKVDMYYITIINGKASHSCKQCAKTDAKDKYIKEILNDIKDTSVNNWVFTGNAVGYNKNLTTTKQLKLEAVCSCCGNVDSLPYAKLPKVKQCLNCKVR